MTEEKLRQPLPGHCTVRLRAGSYCTNYPVQGSQFCNMHSFKEKEWSVEKQFPSLKKHYELIGKIWIEATTKVIANDDPTLTLTDLFDFIQFSLEEEGIFTNRGSITSWFRDTKERYDHPAELLDLKHRFHFGNTPYKKILEEGIPKTNIEKLAEFIDKNPDANLDQIIEGTGLTKDRVYYAAREVGIKLEGQRDTGMGISEIENLLRKIAKEKNIPQTKIIKIKSAKRANFFKVEDDKLYIKFSKKETSWPLNRIFLEDLELKHKDFFVGLMHNDFNRIFIIPFYEISDYIDSEFEEIHISLKSGDFLSLTGSPVYFEAGPWLNNYNLSRDPEWN